VKAKLIFNPASGNPTESAMQLVELLRQLQMLQIQVEVLLVQPEHRLPAIARSAARAGAKMVIVSGGDGTIENVALGLVGSRTTLGIIPTGTRNNLARSLGIPTDTRRRAALLRKGRRSN
jgi:diacylglycerol kinase family enzyme